MKNILKWFLSLSLLIVAAPSAYSMDMNEKASMEEVKKKKYKKKKKASGKDSGKKAKKGFWSNFFGGN